TRPPRHRGRALVRCCALFASLLATAWNSPAFVVSLRAVEPQPWLLADTEGESEAPVEETPADAEVADAVVSRPGARPGHDAQSLCMTASGVPGTSCSGNAGGRERPSQRCGGRAARLALRC